eukprot:SAG31_NODE_237_length_19590_cov_13.149915_21_plen_124_part_00
MATSLSGSAPGVQHTQVQDIPRCTAFLYITKKLCATRDVLNAASPILRGTHLVRCAELSPLVRKVPKVPGGAGHGARRRGGLLRAQLFCPLRIGAQGRRGAAGAAAAARRATRGSGGVGAVDV